VRIDEVECYYDTDESNGVFGSYKPDMFIGVTINNITDYTNSKSNDYSVDFNWEKEFITNGISDIQISLWDEDSTSNELIGSFNADPGNVSERVYRGNGWMVKYSVSYGVE